MRLVCVYIVIVCFRCSQYIVVSIRVTNLHNHSEAFCWGQDILKGLFYEENKPKMAYSCDLAVMDFHGLSWMTFMDDSHG